MKKIFEKHDLFKIVLLFMLIPVIFSWVMTSGAFSAGTFTASDMTRIGLFDFSSYTLLGFYYFTVNLVFVLVVAGFYKFLGSLEAYQSLTSKLANAWKGKEKIVVAISILLFACLAGLLTEHFALLVIVPFVITVLSKMEVDKVTGVSATFGGILVGLLGATYAGKVVGAMVDANYGIGVSYGFEMMGTIVLFAISYLLLTYFTLVRMSKISGKKVEAEVLVDPFASSIVEDKKSKKKTTAKKVSVLPLVIILVLVLLNTVLAYIPWVDAFKIEIFDKALTWIQEATIFGKEYFAYLLGGETVVKAFGQWDLLNICGIMLFAILVIKIIYHVSFDQVIEEFGSGMKGISKTVVIMLMIYSIILFTLFYPTLPVLIDLIQSLGNNVFTLFASGVLGSIFTVELQYTITQLGSLFANFQNVSISALALQSAAGLVSFIAPTSLILMIGLSMLDVKFKDWVKHIWKFVLALLIIILVILAILMYV